MADRNPIDPKALKGAAEPTARVLPCEEWEALLTDALDGSLPPTQSAAFKNHTDSCSECTELLLRAKQGQEWLQFLSPPRVSPDLVGKILAKTSGAAAASVVSSAGAHALPAALPVWQRMGGSVRRAAEPRMLMTAAMAFFSIALTLNLAGIRFSGVRMADLNPSSLRSNLTRQFINSKVGVENYCYNLRIVYEMEARVRELKRTSEADEAPAPQQQAPSNAPSGAPKGSAHKGGRSEAPHNAVPRASLWGSSVEASLRGVRIGIAPEDIVAACVSEVPSGNGSGLTEESYVRPYTDRAEGSLA